MSEDWATLLLANISRTTNCVVRVNGPVGDREMDALIGYLAAMRQACTGDDTPRPCLAADLGIEE